MTVDAPAARQFILLCIADRQPLYAAVLTSLGHSYVMVDDIPQLLAECCKTPPLAVLVDAVSAGRLGAATVNPLFEVRASWPVLRCTPRPDSKIAVMCTAPYRQDLLESALQAIAAGDPAWSTPWQRVYVRMAVLARARLRAVGATPWQDSNLLDVSPRGAFVVSYGTHQCGDALELEIHDICAEPVGLRARVVWCRRWSDGPSFPGLGLEFDADTVPEGFRREVGAAMPSPPVPRPTTRKEV